MPLDKSKLCQVNYAFSLKRCQTGDYFDDRADYKYIMRYLTRAYSMKVKYLVEELDSTNRLHFHAHIIFPRFVDYKSINEEIPGYNLHFRKPYKLSGWYNYMNKNPLKVYKRWPNHIEEGVNDSLVESIHNALFKRNLTEITECNVSNENYDLEPTTLDRVVSL